MAQTFKALSALLCYPGDSLKAASGEMRAALAADGILADGARRALDGLIAEIAGDDLLDLQERYVLLFDRTGSLSLYLFEHVHGESRDRGQAMIDLQAHYERNGLAIGAAELPDFLPLFLEFLSTRPLPEAREMLGQTAHILTALAERLHKRGSSYEAVFRALVEIAGAKPKAEEIAGLLDQPDTDPTDLAAIDKAWEDQPVTFGPGAAECKDGLIARIRAAKRPASARA
ncbi:MAG: nitrate reductase molybdenum cofactor assembly chaperone [Xanthobacteraceae bacterium]